jgi:hypothetical protein
VTRAQRTLLALVGVLLAAPAARADDAAPAKARSYWFNFQEEYRFRSTGTGGTPGLYGESEQDHDLRLFGAGGWRCPQDRFLTQASMALWLDLDGVHDGEPSTLGSIYDDPVRVDIYSAYAEYHSKKWLREIRLGRQNATYGVPVTFDGLHARFRPAPILDIFVFGGHTWHFFETDSDDWDDWMASGGVSLLPTEGLRIDLDYRFTLEDTQTQEAWIDHSYGGTIWYNPLAWLYLKANARGIGDEFSHVGFHARLEFDRIHLGVRLGADSQLVELRELNERDNPFFAILGPSLPHTRWEAAIWKAFPAGAAGTYTLEAGWNHRLVHQDETEFNRDNGKAYLLFTAEDFGVPGPFIQAAVEAHFAKITGGSGDESLITAGGAAGYKNRFLRAEVGTWYQRFKYDYYRDVQEVEDVRTVFGAVTWKALEWLSIKARYQYENLEDRDMHTVLFSLTQSL